MPVPGDASPNRWPMTLALVENELRVLWQNRMACAVLVLALLTAVILRLDRDRQTRVGDDVCYVLYWEEDDFVRSLKGAALRARNEQGLAIEVLPADELTDGDGIIRYPAGSHSIQLRLVESPAGAPPGHLAWYWHSGADPAALWPFAEWFQQEAFNFFGGTERWEVRTSPLQPELVIAGQQTKLSLEALRRPGPLDLSLVWIVLFFAACHLPKLSLAESQAGGMLVSVAVTSAGWRGLARAVRLVYGTLAMLLAAAVAGIVRPSLLATAEFWLASLTATVLYLGVAFVIAGWCRSVASASAATPAYLALSGLAGAVIAGASLHWGVKPAFGVLAEPGLYLAVRHAWDGEGAATGLSYLAWPAAWAVAWHATGEASFRRRQQE